MKEPNLEKLLKIITIHISKEGEQGERYRELPNEFSGIRANNIAISRDYNKFAHKGKDGYWYVHDMPEDGKVEIDGSVISCKKGSGMSVSSVGSISNIVVGSGNVISSIGVDDKKYEIDQAYRDVKIVTLEGATGNIELGFSKESEVYASEVFVQGKTNAEPELQMGLLSIKGLEGKLDLPKNNTALSFGIHINMGNVDGDVAHGGRIKTNMGNISLDLYAPLILKTKSNLGSIDVIGMTSKGRGVYTSPDKNPIGTLEVKTNMGNIRIKYLQ